MNKKQKSGHAKRKAKEASELKTAALNPKQLKLDF